MRINLLIFSKHVNPLNQSRPKLHKREYERETVFIVCVRSHHREGAICVNLPRAAFQNCTITIILPMHMPNYTHLSTVLQLITQLIIPPRLWQLATFPRHLFAKRIG